MGNICVSVNPVQRPSNKIETIVRYDKNAMKKINQYTELKGLGQCSFGVVSLVMDNEQKQFAMRTGQRRFLSPAIQFASEMAVLKCLQHSNLLRSMR